MSSPSGFEHALELALQQLEAQNLRRSLRRVSSAQGPLLVLDGRPVLNFSSNDYLGLAAAPALKEAAIKAVERFGAGSGASRLICGSLDPHVYLEQSLAEFKGTESALSFSSGYSTAMGTICAIMGRDDIIVLDKLVHASIVDAARLSNATLRVFPHNDLNSLQEILAWADSRKCPQATAASRSRVLVVTESIFSMDGDHAPLAEIVSLKEKHGAWLMVDEAHATGLYGPNRRGLIEHLGLGGRVEVQMGTLGKALGAAGGYICGSRKLVDLLVNRARSFLFSTAPVPASAAAACAGVGVVSSPEGERLCARLWQRVGSFHGSRPPSHSGILSPIVPIIIGAEQDALNASQRLLEQSVFLPAIRYPTVARGQARLRLSFSAAHEPEHIETLLQCLHDLALKD